MLVVDLHCERGHVFEGWFASADDLAAQQARGLVSCPVCGDVQVTRRPSASRLNVSRSQREAGPGSAAHATAPTPAAALAPSAASEVTVAKLQALYLKAVRQVMQHTEDVGERFADEVRSIHHGDAPERPVRGLTTPQEREALKEEGIEVMTLPVPDALKGTLQ